MSSNRRSPFTVSKPMTIIPSASSIVKEKSTRHNQGKLKWSLIDYKSMEPLVQVMMQGAEKYGIGNWQIGLDLIEIQESMQRHLAALMDGELKDKESSLFHVGHIMANCMMWQYHYNKQNNK